MDAATGLVYRKETAEGSPNGMDTSTTVLGKRTRTTDGAAEMGMKVYGNNEKRPRSGGFEITLAVTLEAAKERA